MQTPKSDIKINLQNEQVILTGSNPWVNDGRIRLETRDIDTILNFSNKEDKELWTLYLSSFGHIIEVLFFDKKIGLMEIFSPAYYSNIFKNKVFISHEDMLKVKEEITSTLVDGNNCQSGQANLLDRLEG